ncbi:MAG TPA: spore germination protein GerW family protein [Candidatus Limnocylindria bacterium]|nr:spore germination protein GerW family protein [Candidatus Limnocylindria bacterium]
MNVDEMIQGAQNALAVSRVYGEPIQQNGVTLIPTAEVMGGGGGGSDEANNGGGGFGVSARPIGMWVIRGEQVEWEPAIDATKMGLRGMLVAIVFLFVLRSVVKTLAGR